MKIEGFSRTVLTPDKLLKLEAHTVSGRAKRPLSIKTRNTKDPRPNTRCFQHRSQIETQSIRSSFGLITIPKFVHQTSLAIVPGEFGPPRGARKGHRYQFKKAL